MQRKDMLTEFFSMGYGVGIQGGILDNLVEPEEPLFQSVMFMETNPFQWGYEGDNRVTSRIMGIQFKHKEGGEIRVQNLSKDRRIELIMPNTASLSDVSTPTNISSLFDPGASLKTQFNTSAYTSAALNIEVAGSLVPGDNETEDDVADLLALTAYIGYGFEPFWYKYSEKLVINSNATNHQQYTFFV